MFLQKYKKLDNLCKDLLNSKTGVSSYIESMEQCEYSRKIAGWEDDYKDRRIQMHPYQNIKKTWSKSQSGYHL